MALTELVLMPGSDYQGICDKIREKTGEEELLKSGQITAELDKLEKIPATATVTISVANAMNVATSILYRPDDSGNWNVSATPGSSSAKTLTHLKVGEVVAIERSGTGRGGNPTVTGGTAKNTSVSNSIDGTTIYRSMSVITITAETCTIRFSS